MTRAKPGTGWARDLAPSAWSDLDARARLRRLSRGSALFVQGEGPGAAAVLLEGRLKVVHVADDGTESLLAIRGTGDLVGELSVLDGAPRSATVTALEPAAALVVDADGFRAWLQAHPEAMLELLALVAARLRDADSTRAQFATADVTARLARRLLELAARYGEPGSGGVRIDLPVTQEDLAGWVGASREAVAKGMRRLRQRGAVVTGRRRVEVCDLAALRRLAR